MKSRFPPSPAPVTTGIPFRPPGFVAVLAATSLLSGVPLPSSAQIPVTTPGFLNSARPELPGTLLSSPAANDSAGIGRTTTLNYVNGWLIVGAEQPGSADGSDYSVRVYDISNPVAPQRRVPLDFGLDYPQNRWYSGNSGWNAHGSAQSGPYLLPLPVLRVSSFGGPVELGGTGDVPALGELALGYNRSSQAGPWVSTLLWYNSPDQDMVVQRASIGPGGGVSFQTLATFDHTGQFGGGDWHPMFFGDLLVYARSGGAARDGVVVYRLGYENFGDGNPANDTVTPNYVGSLPGGFEGYWPTLFSDGSGLYVIGSATNILTAANITEAATPGGEDAVTLAATLTVPNFTNASYPVFQDQFGFIHNRKINMTSFLAGDPNPIVLTLNEGAPNNIDTSQMSLALGNLWITGGYPVPGRSQGMAVWVHQQAPDETPPAVTYHIPQANRTNYPRFAPLSFLLHEHPRHGGPRNGIDFSVRPVQAGNTLGTTVPGYLIHDFSGVLTFTPTGGLAAETTYQVDFFSDDSDPQNPIGFFDAAGNAIEAYSFRFSTGGGINAVPPPVFTSLTASDHQPEPGENFAVTASATGTGSLEYRFNFNGTWSAWNATNSANHTYLNPGRPRVLAQVRDGNGNVANGTLNLLVLEAPTGPQPTRSSTMAIGNDPGGRRLWTVNPDANTVAVLDAANGEMLDEHAVGENPRSIARDSLGRYWVTCMGSDEIRVLNPDGSAFATLSLPYGSAPFGIAPSPDGQQLFVTLYGSGRLHRYQAANPNNPPAIRETFPTPRALAISGDGQRVLVTRFLSPDLEAEVSEFHGTLPGLDGVRTIRLSSANPADGGDRASGVPNYLAGIAISPDGTRAAVVSKQDNIQRGLLHGVADMNFETTVRAVVSFLDLTNNQEIRHSRRDFDNSDSPSAVAYSPLGDLLLVSMQGKNRITGIDTLGLAPVIAPDTAGSTETSPAVPMLDLGTGQAPQGLQWDPVNGHLFIQDFMGRTVTVLDASGLLEENRTSLPHLITTPTVGNELLSPQVLLGKQIFYNAADSRMSADSYISCASCHIDGGHDGRIWDFTGRGEGLRRTTDLRGRSGTEHGNVHWTANFDEIQDFEHDIRGPFGGSGFLTSAPAVPMTAQEFAATHPTPGTTKAGLDPELDALAAYVASLGAEEIPRSPHRLANGSMTAAALRGRDHFAALNCASCHSGPGFTDSMATLVASPFLHDVGTTSGLSGQRLGQPLAGIDTPSLRGLHTARNYLHHGQAGTLEDVFTYSGGALLLANQAQILNPGPVYLESDIPAQGGGGFVRGALGGSFANLGGEAGYGIRFNNVDGGPDGGMARLSLRYIRQYGPATATLRVNGMDYSFNVLRQYPDNGWQLSGWQWITVDAPLQAGSNNTIDVLRGSQDLQANALLVANAADRATTSPHGVVMEELTATERDDLFAYLRQLDSTADLPPVYPVPTLSLAPGQDANSDRPFAEFDIEFSRAVTGLDGADFTVSGTAGATHRHLTTLLDGTHYRLRLAGFSQAGTVSIQLPAGSVVAEDNGEANPATPEVAVSYVPPGADDIAGHSDEFNDAGTLSDWSRNEFTEGWNAGKLEQWNINTTTPGHMRLMPWSSSWYQDFTGAYAYKEITGDFVLTTRLDVTNRAGTGRPNSDFSLAGLMVRASRGVTAAAPQPDPGPNTVLPWPPAGAYTTDWAPGTENYIFLSFGFGSVGLTSPDGSNPNRWHYEVKTTTNGVSTLYPRTHGVPENEETATLQIVRRGSTFLLLRQHGNGPWILENRFERTDLPATLQVGLTTYTDWNFVSAGWNFVSPVQPFHQNRIANIGTGNPDLIADVDYVRLSRPPLDLDAADLQAAAVTGPNGPVVPLAGSALEPYLGNTANVPPPDGQTYHAWLATHFTPAQLADPAISDPGSDPDSDGLPNVIDFLTDGNPRGSAPLSRPGLVLVDDGEGGQVHRYQVGVNPSARGWRLIVETATTLADWNAVAQSDHGQAPAGTGVLGNLPGLPVRTLVGPGTGIEDGPTRFYRLRAEVLP